MSFSSYGNRTCQVCGERASVECDKCNGSFCEKHSQYGGYTGYMRHYCSKCYDLMHEPPKAKFGTLEWITNDINGRRHLNE